MFVVKKDDLDEIKDTFTNLASRAQQNPIITAGAFVALLFLLLFVFGSSSSNQ